MTATTINKFTGPHAFLSNFYRQPMTVLFDYGGTSQWMQVPTLEHAFQALKATTFADFHRVCIQGTPGGAKRVGRRIRLRPDWDDIRDEVMLQLLRSKFRERAEMRNLLLATGDAQLVEGNDWGDTYWGVCRGRGQNRLGQLLMQVRQELREGKL